MRASAGKERLNQLKASIVITLIITGGILILAPVVCTYQQNGNLGEVLPYLVSETQAESGHTDTNRIAFLDRSIARLDPPLSHRYRLGCAVLGTFMIVVGACMAIGVKSSPEKARNFSAEATKDGFK